MADGVNLPLTGAGDATAKAATDDCGAAGHAQIIKLAVSTDGSATLVGADGNGLDVDVARVADGADVALGATADADTANTVIGRLKKLVSLLAGGLPAALSAGGGVKVGVVDALPAGTNAIGKLAANDGVDIGDVSVNNTVTVDSELTTADLDSGAGTDTRAVVGIVGSKSGGAQLIPGDATAGLKVDLGADNDVTLGAALPAGTNAIGKLAANSGVDIGDVDVTSVPARSRTVDAIAVALQTDAIMNGLTALTPKFAKANVSASQTDSSIVSAVASKKIRVLAVFAVAGATATNLTFNSKPAGAGTAISPLLANGANGGEVLGFNPAGWFETSAGEGLTVTTGAGSTTGVGVVYVEV